MKKMIGFILCFAVFLNAVVPAFGNGPSLGDIQNHWAEKAILEAQARGLVGGYPDGTFKPNEQVSYGMVFTVLDRIFSQLSPTYTWALSDAESEDFAALFDIYILELLQESITHFTERHALPEYPENVRALVEETIAALHKDLGNYEYLKNKYALSTPSDLEEDFANFIAELSTLAINDKFLALAETYGDGVDPFDNEKLFHDPFLSFYLDYAMFAQGLHLAYFLYLPAKMNYGLKTQDLSATERIEIQKQIIRFTMMEEFEFYVSEKSYAFPHYMNVLMGTLSANGPYTYLRPGVYMRFLSVDFDRPITRDALFGLVNQLLLSTSPAYEEHNDMLAFALSSSIYEETQNLFAEDIETLMHYNLVQGSGNETGNKRLKLDDYLTRAELATMANRIYDFLSNMAEN